MIDTNADLELAHDRISALEHFIHEFLPLLISGSPQREEIERRLQAWADEDTVDRDQSHSLAVGLAEQVLEQSRAL